MLTSLADGVGEFVRNFRPADLVDITLVALFLYPSLGWLRRGASPLAARRFFIFAFAVTAVFLLARVFELYLVGRLLEVFLLLALVAVVVVFQQELRRLLNHLGSWRPFRPAHITTPSAVVVDDLVEAVNHLAERNIGALIALKGREAWGDHIHGGVKLDGEVSQPLLYSLFNPETPGHDGAVLLEDSRISKFAVHLPLASELPEASRYGGTRHAAALGLSEHCDALILVVSEERGIFSVAERGKLEELDSAAELKERLERFWERDQRREGAWSPRGLTTGLLSFSLATLLWLLFAYSPDTVFRTLEVPVVVHNVPAEWELDEIEPDLVRLTLSGPERAFEQLDREALTISFDLENLEEGTNNLAISEESIALPARLELYNVEPRRVRVEAQRLAPAEVRVEVPTVGALPDGLTLAGLRPRPERVTLLVEADGPTPQRVLTEPLDLRNIEASGPVERSLILPQGWRLPPEGRGEVEVVVEVREE